MALTKITRGLLDTGVSDSSDATAITIDSSENVGIGLTNPSDYYATELVVDASDEGGISVVNGTTEAGYLAFADGTSGAAQYTGYLSYDHNVDALTSRSAGYINFMTGGGTERMRIDSNGNVGVGTASPNAYSNVTTMTVNGTNQGRVDLEYGGTLSGSFLALSGQTQIKASGGSQVMVFEVNDAERMRIDTSGLVGIGRTPSSSTGSMLQVEGNDGIAMRRPSQTNNFTLRPNASTDGIRFTQEGAGDRMTIDASGKLGVGTTSPTHTLHAPTARLGEEKWLNSVSAYYISSGTINRNLTIDLNGSAEYYLIIYIVGIWPYTASAAGTRIIEVTGYGSTQNAISVISNAGSGGNPNSVTVTASGGNVNVAIGYNNTYRWNASAKVVYGANGMTMSVDGTNG